MRVIRLRYLLSTLCKVHSEGQSAIVHRSRCLLWTLCKVHSESRLLSFSLCVLTTVGQGPRTVASATSSVSRLTSRSLTASSSLRLRWCPSVCCGPASRVRLICVTTALHVSEIGPRIGVDSWTHYAHHRISSIGTSKIGSGCLAGTQCQRNGSQSHNIRQHTRLL